MGLEVRFAAGEGDFGVWVVWLVLGLRCVGFDETDCCELAVL